MLPEEYKLLKYIRDNGPCTREQALDIVSPQCLDRLADNLQWVDVIKNDPKTIALSMSGRDALHAEKQLKREQRWTRGLAIAAIIISLCTLFLEAQDRGWFTPGKIPAKQSSSVQSELRELTE